MGPLTPSLPLLLQLQLEKHKGEILGVVVVESGWGSILPTVILANMMNGGPAARSGKLSIGDQIMSINGTSLVGLPLATCQGIIKVGILGFCALPRLAHKPHLTLKPRETFPVMSPSQSADPKTNTCLKSEEDPSFPSKGRGRCHLPPGKMLRIYVRRVMTQSTVPGIFPGYPTGDTSRC